MIYGPELAEGFSLFALFPSISRTYRLVGFAAHDAYGVDARRPSKPSVKHFRHNIEASSVSKETGKDLRKRRRMSIDMCLLKESD